jgi:type IV pilus assembly protein PilB
MSRLREHLLRHSRLKAADLDEAVAASERDGLSLAASLVRLGSIDPRDLAHQIGALYGLDVVERPDPDDEALALVPSPLARRRRVLPLQRIGSLLTIAIGDPADHTAVSEVRFVTGCDPKLVVAPISALERAIDTFYPEAGRARLDALARLADHEPRPVSGPDPDDGSARSPLIRFVDAMLGEALAERASDVHIEPYEDDLRIRFRIDGVLYERMQPPSRLASALVSRIKVMSGLDISERRMPQDGTLRLRTAGRSTSSFRVSVLPTIFGEKVVLRAVQQAPEPPLLESLGLRPVDLAAISEVVDAPCGLVLVTGPTGSGKTNTLYSLLARLNQPTRNVATAEDPVELTLRGVNQVQINEAAGLTFAAALRSFLRQDPDVIMVGEVRDAETAEIAVKASLTGHLVLSTLHTNDAPSAVTRLLQMGVEPFLLASSLRLVIAQRLLRKICPACSGGRSNGRPCSDCGGTGYRGRLAAFEVMRISEEDRERIVDRASPSALRKASVARGMQTLRQAALARAADGLTRIEEAVRVTPDD